MDRTIYQIIPPFSPSILGYKYSNSGAGMRRSKLCWLAVPALHTWSSCGPLVSLVAKSKEASGNGESPSPDVACEHIFVLSSIPSAFQLVSWTFSSPLAHRGKSLLAIYLHHHRTYLLEILCPKQEHDFLRDD
jgi:hypothetical protein